MHNKELVHLHVHTEFSVLDGAAKVSDLTKRSKELGFTHLAISDHGTMRGCVIFYKFCKTNGIVPIIGSEVYVVKDRTRKEFINGKPPIQSHLVLLCKNYKGYENLVQIITDANINGFYYRPRTDLKFLKEHSEGLIALSACLKGHVPRMILNDDMEKAERYCRWFKDVFGDDFYLEYQFHEVEGIEKVNLGIYALSKKLGIKTVTTSDLHYINKEDQRVHEILLYIQTKKTLKDKDSFKFESKQNWLKVPEEFLSAAQVFSPSLPLKEVERSLRQTKEVSEKCEDLHLDEVKVKPIKFDEKKNSIEILSRICKESYRSKLFNSKKNVGVYSERLKYELKVIKDLGFEDYFLLSWDICRFALKNGIPKGPGRGSVTGSLVSYLCGITDVNPLKWGLPFERFLDPKKKDAPDIDIDFSPKGRDKIISYLKEKYGQDHIAHIGTYLTFGGRTCLTDISRVYGLNFWEMKKITEKIPFDVSLEQSCDKESLNVIPEVVLFKNNHPEIFKIAIALEDQVRGISRHAAGVVLSGGPLSWVIPLQRRVGGEEDELITEYIDGAKSRDLTGLGGIKLDILGLNTLQIIKDTLEKIGKTMTDLINLDSYDDKKVYKDLSSGNVCGVFQFDTDLNKDLLSAFKPESMMDLCICNALGRPGPRESGMVNKILQNKKKKSWEYIHPLLREVLDKNYGILLYQEDIMSISRIVGKFDASDTAKLRKLLIKKSTETAGDKDIIERASYKLKFINNAVKENKLKKSKAEEIWNFMEAFASYGFSINHSLPYSIISYWTAWLKFYHPVEFLISCLNNAFDKKYIYEAQRLGIDILPPDVNKSKQYFIDEDGSIRWGLLLIKYIGEGSSDRIISGQPYRSLEDFIDRAKKDKINKNSVKSLLFSGSLDVFGDRRKISEKILEGELFEKIKDKLPELEREYLTMALKSGFLFSEKQKEIARTYRGKKLSSLEDLKNGEEFNYAVFVDSIETKKIKNGEMFILTLFSGLPKNPYHVKIKVWPKVADKMKKEGVVVGDFLIMRIKREDWNLSKQYFCTLFSKGEDAR